MGDAQQSPKTKAEKKKKAAEQIAKEGKLEGKELQAPYGKTQREEQAAHDKNVAKTKLLETRKAAKEQAEQARQKVEEQEGETQLELEEAEKQLEEAGNFAFCLHAKTA